MVDFMTRYEASQRPAAPPVCPKCGSHRTEIIGKADDPTERTVRCNACGAISVVYTNLSRNEALLQNEDFRAPGNLVEGLGRVATLELRQSTGSQEMAGVDLHSVLDELRIVIESIFRESGINHSLGAP